MNINQLKYVLEIANSSSIREASTRLFVSQPALSASIRELEEEIGILIFERTNKGINLTEDGRDFVEYAKKEIFSVSTQHYNFAIKAFTAVIDKLQPEKYVFSIHETKTKEVLDDVKNLKSEVGILSFSGSNEKVMRKLLKDFGLEFTPLMRRETYVYVWKNHKFAGKKEISIEDMRPYPCVVFDQSSDSNFYLSEEAMADYTFDKTIKSSDRATTMEIISELGGFSIGSGMLSKEDAILQGLVAIKLKEEDPLIIGYITRKYSILSHYGEKYIEELLKYKEL